jgi:hypothetical protein
MSLIARCPECGIPVTTVTVLGGATLDRALETNGEVEVACFPNEHRWALNEQDKANLRKHRAAATA